MYLIKKNVLRIKKKAQKTWIILKDARIFAPL